MPRMPIVNRKFVKRPVEVEAIRWTGTPESAEEICNWAFTHARDANQPVVYVPHKDAYNDGEVACPMSEAVMQIDTLEGTMFVSAGDWVIRGVEGEFYPCKPGIFEKTYIAAGERVER